MQQPPDLERLTTIPQESNPTDGRSVSGSSHSSMLLKEHLCSTIFLDDEMTGKFSWGFCDWD